MAKWLENVELACKTTLEVGGSARWCVYAESEDDVVECVLDARTRELGVVVLGGGSNVLVLDEGVDSVVLQVGCKGMDVVEEWDGGVCVRVGGGEEWDAFVEWAVGEGYGGVECLSGIPGWVGAAPMQNIGAYGQEVGDVIRRVGLVDVRTGERSTVRGEYCGFGYRTSRLKEDWAGRYIVVWVEMELRCGGGATVAYPDVLRRLGQSDQGDVSLEEMRRLVLDIRRSKSMVYDRNDENHRSAGSFFVNPVVSSEGLGRVLRAAQERSCGDVPRYDIGEGLVKIPAAWLIERAGFKKGYTRGSVGLSTRHCLALVNRNGASAGEVLALAREIYEGVRDVFGVALEPEPRILGGATEWGRVLEG